MSSGEGNSASPDPTKGERDPELILFGKPSSSQKSPTLEEKASAISEALGNVGLHNAEKITAKGMKLLGQEILGSLNVFTAESVYFNFVRRSRRWLGNEPLHPKEFFKQVKYIHRLHGNLEVFQLRQRLEDLDYLYELGIDPDQLLDLLRGSEEDQQNINRLGFLLKSDPPHWTRLEPNQMRVWVEPKLRGYVENLRKNADIEGPWSVESVVIEAQELLQKELEDILENSTVEDKRQWDSVALALYERVAHRLGSSIAIGHIILHSLRANRSFPPEFYE